jgi:hypothetical protein
MKLSAATTKVLFVFDPTPYPFRFVGPEAGVYRSGAGRVVCTSSRQVCILPNRLGGDGNNRRQVYKYPCKLVGVWEGG